MFENTLQKEELEKLTFLQAGTKATKNGKVNSAANALFNAGEPSNSEAAQDLARKWMKLEHNTRANPEWLVKLNAINSAEPEFQEKLGVTPEVEFLLKAFLRVS